MANQKLYTMAAVNKVEYLLEAKVLKIPREIQFFLNGKIFSSRKKTNFLKSEIKRMLKRAEIA